MEWEKADNIGLPASVPASGLGGVLNCCWTRWRRSRSAPPIGGIDAIGDADGRRTENRQRGLLTARGLAPERGVKAGTNAERDGIPIGIFRAARPLTALRRAPVVAPGDDSQRTPLGADGRGILCGSGNGPGNGPGIGGLGLDWVGTDQPRKTAAPAPGDAPGSRLPARFSVPAAEPAERTDSIDSDPTPLAPARGGAARRGRRPPGVATGRVPRAARPVRHGGPLGRAAGLLVRYAVAVAAVGAALGLTLGLWEPVFSRCQFSLFYAAVIVGAWFGGMGPGLLATALAVWSIDYFILPTFISLRHGWQDLIQAGVFAAVSVLVSSLDATRIRAMAALVARATLRSRPTAPRTISWPS